MTRPIVNITASVKQRLLNVAARLGEEFEQLLVLYVAEKALAMVERGLLNTRMKDYFDLLHLSRERRFDAGGLTRALDATARRRKMSIPAGSIAGLSSEFAGDVTKQAQWAAFSRRLRAGARAVSLPDVVNALSVFLGPVFDAVARERRLGGSWPPGGPWVGGQWS